MKSRNSVFSAVGAVLMLLCALDLIGGLFPALSPLPSAEVHMGAVILGPVPGLPFLAVYILLAVFAFLGKPRALPVIAAAIQCLYGLTLLVGMLFLFRNPMPTTFRTVTGLFFLLKISAALVFLTAVCLRLFGKNGAALFRRLWFLPALLHLAGNLLICLGGPFIENGFDPVRLLLSALCPLAFFFWCLWLRDFVPGQKAVSVRPTRTPAVPSRPQTPDVSDRARKLKACKDLLDQGVITPEEFEAQKKKFLDL